ncbi:MAG TPA: arylsulfatase [Chitinophagaceae bacterium]|nr:arylsulfatase [Chitinophagaceae bacterium]
MKRCLLLMFVNCFLATGVLQAQQKQLPNIVIILADDLGYGDFSSYGAEKVKTPAVDALADGGMRFTDAHSASSLCSPSRYSLMTGRYSWRTPLRAGVLTWFAQPLIEKTRTTLASLLKQSGYYTACIGKWHLGFEWALKPNAPLNPDSTVFGSWELTTQDYIDFSKPVKQGPVERGFDYYYGIAASNNMIPFVFIENDRVRQAPAIKKEYVYDTDQESVRAPDWDLETLDADLTKKAVEVIDRHFSQQADKPLFLYYPTSAIHRPCLPTDTKGKSQAGLRGDMILTFDLIVAEVVAALKRNNAFENTLIIVTSDNGGVPGDAVLPLEKYREDMGDLFYPAIAGKFTPQYVNPQGNAVTKKGWITYDHASAGSFRGYKSDAWEGGHRVPLILHWPGKIKSGSVMPGTVCHVDILATFAELTGKKLTAAEGEDSYSFLPAVLGQSVSAGRSSLTMVAGGSGAYVVRIGDWKYIEGGRPAWGQTFYSNGPKTKEFQLYNLGEDPKEEHNLFSVHPEKVAAFKKLIQQVEAAGKTESR